MTWWTCDLWLGLHNGLFPVDTSPNGSFMYPSALCSLTFKRRQIMIDSASPLHISFNLNTQACIRFVAWDEVTAAVASPQDRWQPAMMNLVSDNRSYNSLSAATSADWCGIVDTDGPIAELRLSWNNDTWVRNSSQRSTVHQRREVGRLRWDGRWQESLISMCTSFMSGLLLPMETLLWMKESSDIFSVTCQHGAED